MKSLALAAMVFFTGLLTSFHCWADSKPEDSWHSDYQKGRRIAKETGKPIFLTFR